MSRDESSPLSAGPRRFLVVGLQSLGLGIVHRLNESHAEIAVLAAPHDLAAHRLELPPTVRITASAAVSLEALVSAGVESVDTLILSDDDDASNVDAVLTIRRRCKDLPIIARIFDPTLARYIAETAQPVIVNSVAALAAPVFTDLALTVLAKPHIPSPHSWPHRVARGPRAVRVRPDRILVAAFLAHLFVVVLATSYFTHELRLHPIDALYFVASTVTTVGYGDISLRTASSAAKVVGMFLMFTGAAFVGVLLAFFTGWVVDRRLEVLYGRVPERGRNHIVIAGAGNVGLSVGLTLRDQGFRIVFIERNPSVRNVAKLRDRAFHVIVGEATSDEILALARVQVSAVVLALTDSDAVNLELALTIRDRYPSVPIVLRLRSAEIARDLRFQRHLIAQSSIDIAAERFTKAALESRQADGH